MNLLVYWILKVYKIVFMMIGLAYVIDAAEDDETVFAGWDALRHAKRKHPEAEGIVAVIERY